uniref:Uncharacterized protein n=1 Tax=Ditylenchus dipsaci TaxID=166011 RepID=A0A915D8M4_9BILA
MDILLCKRALSRCILAVSSLPISYRCASVDALRTDVSKLCFKQSLLVSSLSVQRGGKIDFRRLSTTSLQVGGNVDLVEAASVGSVSEPIFNGLRKKKFITGESASNVKIKPSATPLFFNSNVSIRMFCSSFYGNSWLDALKIPNETKPIIKEKLDDMERLYLEARENVKEARSTLRKQGSTLRRSRSIKPL